jgi:hypothetical protein
VDIPLAIAIVLACAGLVVGAMMLLRRRAPKGGYYTDSARAAGVLTVLGTAFSVLLAFVIFLAFQSYDGADEAAGLEAVSVKEQFEAAELFAPQDRDALQGDLICYGRAVISDEWPLMRDGGRSALVDGWVVTSERTLDGVRQGDYRERTAFDKWFDQEAERDQARSTRLLEGDGVIPSPLWLVLLLGAAVLIGSMLLFADPAEGRGAQAMLIGTVTALVVTSLLAADFLDNPYREGAGSLDPEAMEQAVGAMEDERGEHQQAAPLPCSPSGEEAGRQG